MRTRCQGGCGRNVVGGGYCRACEDRRRVTVGDRSTVAGSGPQIPPAITPGQP
jgi:hypothetical protein